MVRHRDPLHKAIELALQPHRFIGWNQETDFVSALREVEHEIATLIAADPPRAVSLYETFIAACYLKVEEIDSEWEFGNFVADLACKWIQARQAAGADSKMTAETLLSWMDRDDYGFFNDLGSDAVKVLELAGLAAFEAAIRVRFEDANKKRNEKGGNYLRDHWGSILRSIYVQQRSIEKYLDLTVQTALTPPDCAAIATMFQAKRKPTDALDWLERGLKLEGADSSRAGVGCNLAGMRRTLLLKLRRGNEALDSAWAEFQAHPSKFTYEELFRYVPKSDCGAWHEKAMAVAGQGELSSLIEMWIEVKETERLAERLNGVGDRELEELSHYVTEPAAKALARTHPDVAAKLYRALCMRILNAGKSNYYYAALANLEEARRCYLAAGLDDRWSKLAVEIRRNHFRKSGFMPGFEAVVAGKRTRVEPSFLEKARGQWTRKVKV